MEAAPVENSHSVSLPSNTGPDPSNTGHHPANSAPDPSNTGHHPANSAPDPSNTGHHPANSAPDPSNPGHHPANSAPDPSNTDHHPANSVPDPQNDREMEPNHQISEEEATSIMEVIAATGKFWHDWDLLKGLLASRLKQVLAEYPEGKTINDMIGPQQSCLLGETYPELVQRLDEALLSFVEGPPFTLQRLCEILLNARSIYPNLSKLALALEKNLLVTSTLTMSTDPYPLSTSHKAVEPEKGSNRPEAQPNPTENGTEAMSNGDEEMVDAEVEEEKIHENKEEMETSKETANDATKTSPEPATISEAADPPLPMEQLNHTSS